MNRALSSPRYLRIPRETRTRAETAKPVTLLELVRTVSEVTDDDREIVATVVHMLRSGRVRLAGNFRDTPVEELG